MVGGDDSAPGRLEFVLKKLFINFHISKTHLRIALS